MKKKSRHALAIHNAKFIVKCSKCLELMHGVVSIALRDTCVKCHGKANPAFAASNRRAIWETRKDG